MSSVVSRSGHTLFTPSNGVGGCVLPSAMLGDRIIGVVNTSTGGVESTNFETTVSKPGQLQQLSSSNLSSTQYIAFYVG
jgi:hypothetical protein